MLLALIVCHLSVFVAANPFHKYPFVFLLDVGNEELEKTNSEQIRVSVPGGSIAIRYPAIGYGNTIGHIRVSGIDFGTDLKASIVDGGPGYRYVVLVFMGKSGTPYDAVLTVQTVVDNNDNVQNVGNVANCEFNTNQEEEDTNDSAEDLTDTDGSNNVSSEDNSPSNNVELLQSSSNLYSYVNNEPMNETEDAYDDNDDNEYNSEEIDSDKEYSEETGKELVEKADVEDVNSAQDIHSQYIDDIDKEEPNDQVENSEYEDEAKVLENNDDEVINLKTESAAQRPESIDKNSFPDYENLQERLDFEKVNDVYSQENYQKSSYYREDPLDYDPYAEENNEDAYKYRDFNNNNNYIESDDSYAVAY